MTRLFIEGNEVDITSELSQQITFAVDDIRKIDSKATTYSKTIVLPGTALNNRIFGNIYELSRSNDQGGSGPNSFFQFDPTRSAAARLEINGLLIMKGIARLLMIRRTREAIEYEVALFGELGGFISSVGNNKLEDLDFSQYDHQWNETNIINSWADNKTITASIAISGPFSSINYNPPIDYIRFRFTGQIPWLSPDDEFTVTNTASNNGTYIAYDVIYNAGLDQTDIIVQYFPPDPFVPETAGSGTITKPKTWGAGYACPLIDYGQVQSVNFPLDHDFRHFRPALFVREYMDKIIHAAGFTFESTFFDTPFFRRLIIPNNDPFLQKIGTSDYLDAISNDTSETFAHPVKPQGYSAFPTFVPPLNSRRAINWNTINLITSFTSGAIFGSPAGKFTYTGGGAISIKISVNIDIYLSIRIGGSVRFSLIQKSGSTQTSIAEKIFYTWSGLASFEFRENITINGGDEIWVQYIATRDAVPYGTTADLVVDANGADSTIKIVQDPPGWVQYNYNDVLEINKLIPKNVLQRDFFLSVVKMFNLMITEDPLRDNHLVITPYIDFYNPDPTSYLDWSYKIAREKTWQIKPMSEANARIYDFKYKDDNDYYNDFYKKKYNETYGNKQFDNQLEFSKDKAAVEVIFSPSVLVGYEDEDKIFPAIYKFEESTTTKTAQGHNIRIMQIKHITEIAYWDMYDNATRIQAALTSYLYCGHFDNPNNPQIDLNWGVTRELFYDIANTNTLQNNLFLNFYSPYMAEIINRDSKLLTCDTFLTERDIVKLDFRRLIMIDGVLFRLQKIIDWQAGELSKTELLRVINTTYPATIGSSRYLRITFNDMSGLPTDLDGWNAAFKLPDYGDTFTLLEIQGNEVYLYGSGSISLLVDYFTASTQITKFEDFIGIFKGSIETGAFADCHELTTIYLPSITEIENGGFSKCYKLKSIYMPMLEFCKGAFTSCTSLKSVSLPKLKEITDDNTTEGSFEDCSSLDVVDFPELKEIGESAFQNTPIKKLIFPKCQTVKTKAFAGMSALAIINLPNCTGLGPTADNDSVFSGTTSLTIKATFNQELQTVANGDPDGDIQYLEANNSVDILYI